MSRHVVPKFKMRCCVPLCCNDADNVTQPSDISFHMFPDSEEMRKFWLDALDLHAWHEKDPKAISTAVVCSEHFASADLYNTKSGFRKLRVGAVPLMIQETLDDEAMAEDEEPLVEQLQVCRICLETEGRLIPMSECKLEEVYQNLTGFAMSNDLRLSQTFCPECAQRLKNFEKFREKSLTADLLISNLLKKTEWSIKEDFMKIERKEHGLPSNLAKLFINYDHFDLFIQEDTQNVDDDQQVIRLKPKTEMDELTVLNINNTPIVSGASINVDKLMLKPNQAPKLPRLAPKPVESNNPRIAPKSNLIQIAPKTNASPILLRKDPQTNIEPSLKQITAKTNTTPSLLQKYLQTNKNPTLQQKTPQTAPKPDTTPKRQIVKTNVTPNKQNRIEKDTKMNRQEESIQTTNVIRQYTNRKFNENNQATNSNTPIVENQIIVTNESNPDNKEQSQVKVDYIPVIDVVIDNKFKIVRKEEILLKNAQIIFNNNKAVVQEMQNNKAIIRNKRGVPIGIDLNKGNLVKKSNQQIIPIMTHDRIIMPTSQDTPQNTPTTQNKSTTTTVTQENLKPQNKSVPITKTVQKHSMIRNIPKNTQLQQINPKSRAIIQQDKSKTISSGAQDRKNLSITKNNQKHMPIITDENEKDNQTEIDNNQTKTDNFVEVPVVDNNYEEQEFYEESIEETVVTEDYIEMQSESDNEMEDIKKEVEKIIKEEKGIASNMNTDAQNENVNETNESEGNENENNETWDAKQENTETWDEYQENYETWEESQEINETWDENQENNETWDENQENNETWDENQDNNETWDENQENNETWNENSGKWEPDEFSEDNENDQNSEEDQNEEITDRIKKKFDKFDPEQLKRARMQRKRRSVLRNYGKTYFNDDLNDVVFTITQLSFEEQLVEIRNRLYTKYKNAAYSCEFCYRGFMNEYAYNRHIALHNSDDGDHECAVCKFKFKTPKLLENHVAARHATKFSCNLCSFACTAAEPARQHGMKHRGIRYQCPHCPEDYLRYTVLMDHMAIKHTAESLCPVCGLKLSSDEDLERHKFVRHVAQLDLDQWDNATHCERCDILFASEEAYRFHLGVSIKHDSEFIMEHHKAKRNQEQEFLKPATPYKKTEVTGPLTCEQCGETLPSLRKYHAHFRRDHPDKTRTFYPTMKKKVMCELCGRFFKAQWQYVEHLRLHTNERPYECEFCGKSFITNRLLCAHRYVHGGAGPRSRPDIRCKLCGKTFANKGNLHRHMGVHSDEKRFKCEICNTAYRQKAEMKSHYDHVHLRKPWPKRNRPRRDYTAKSVPTSEDDTSQQYVVEEVAEEMEIDN